MRQPRRPRQRCVGFPAALPVPPARQTGDHRVEAFPGFQQTDQPLRHRNTGPVVPNLGGDRVDRVTQHGDRVGIEIDRVEHVFDHIGPD